jgi:hypothetical protein
MNDDEVPSFVSIIADVPWQEYSLLASPQSSYFS